MHLPEDKILRLAKKWISDVVDVVKERRLESATTKSVSTGSPTDEETNCTPYEQITTSSPIQEETTEPELEYISWRDAVTGVKNRDTGVIDRFLAYHDIEETGSYDGWSGYTMLIV